MGELTREKAANLLDNLIGMFEDNQDNDYDAALRMGIEALTSVSAVARDIATIIENEQDMRVILAQPQRMRGRWIEIQAPDSDGNALYECSICHSGEVHVPIVEVPFCWHCGADMREGEG